MIIICALLLVGVRRRDVARCRERRRDRSATATRSAWLYIGVGLSSTVVLVVALVWAVRVMADIDQPPHAPALTIEVTGQQWWWKARYLDR